LKQFPHALEGGLNDDALTETQWIWLSCHLLLDDGVNACPSCDALGHGPYCEACGVRLTPEVRTCQECEREVGAGAYCPQCGATVTTAIAESIAAGDFDWEAWAKSLEPFLGGLTPQEAALLARG
jgi:predicted amidophosphoribosyltransferase